MLNLKQLFERYSDVGLGFISFGGKSFYEINSNLPLNLNSYGGKDGFILNKQCEVQLYEIFEAPYLHYFKNELVSADEYYRLEESDLFDESDFKIQHNNIKKWFGKTLDHYFPHPWYPDKKIIGFEVVNNIPFYRKGASFEVTDDKLLIMKTLKGSYDFLIEECLNLPEFFKPIYSEIK